MTSELAVRTPGLSVAMKNARKSAQANGITCIYRYAEVLLMYAEASTRATNTVSTDALNAIQEVQKRADYPDRGIALTTTTDAATFLKIAEENQFLMRNSSLK